jgi:hypothetical protein
MLPLSCPLEFTCADRNALYLELLFGNTKESIIEKK